jgi:CzcA family heavy metal efflux pump
MYDFSIRHSRAVLFVLAVIMLAGVYSASQMPVSLFPNVTFPRISIIADNGEEPAERMMVEVTKPLEDAVNSVPGVTTVRSTTSRGSAEISIFFKWGTDIMQSLQFLQLQISSLRSVLPSTAKIEITRMTPSVFPVQGYSLTSDSLSLVDLRDLALYTIRPVLTRVDGVAQVRIQGGRTREFLVKLDPIKLASYHLDIRQVSTAIGQTNIVQSPGLVRDNNYLYLSLVNDLVHNPEEIAQITVATINGAPVHIADIGTVEPSEQVEYTRITANGKQAVLVNIIQQPYGNTVQIGRDVQAKLAELQKSFPKGVAVQNFYDQSDFISSSINGTRDSILIGILLAIVVLMIFLRNWRITIVAVIIVPATIATTLLLLNAANQTVNIMTLGGIAAAIGLIIDDILVVVENIFRHFEESHESFHGAAAASLKELMPAMIGSSAATLVIHIPFAFLGGVTGAFFAALSITMVFALTISFFFSVIAAPVIMSLAVNKKTMDREIAHEHKRSWIAVRYERWLHWLLRYPWIAVPIIAGFMYGAYAFYQQTESDFLPSMDEGAIILDYAAPPGTSLDETNRMLMNVEKIIQSVPDVYSYSRRTGTQMGFFITEPNTGDYAIELKHGNRRSVDDVTEELRTKIQNAEPSLRIDFGQILEDVIGDMISNPAPVEIKVFGDDKPLVEKTAHKISELIAPIPGIVDVFDGVVISGPSLLVNVDAQKASLAGLTVQDVHDQLSAMMQGDVSTSVQHGEKLIGIRVRYPDSYRYDIHALSQTQIFSPKGFYLPLSNVATIQLTPGQSEVHRENLKQDVSVTARLEGRDLGSAVREISKTLAKSLILPAGVTIEYGGLYQSQQESFKGLLMVLGAAALFVFIVLLFEFESLKIPIIVFLVNIPSLFGVIFALWLTNVSFNISSFVGMILIVGIVAENAIFVLHYVMKYFDEGMAVDTALVKACHLRARPVLMTMFAAIFALIPLALAFGSGSQMQQPLAIAIIGGFSVSSILLLFVLPMLCKLFFYKKAR